MFSLHVINADLIIFVFLPQGKLEERKPFMLLFDDVAIRYILSAAQ